MTVYRVRRGGRILDVEGFAALVKMAQDGNLSPEDAVFVPASNRWHYARSIRQLREHFPMVEDPPPPPGKVREIVPREAREPAPEHDPSAAAGGEGTAVADVVPLRRGRWTPEGKGVEVPVFAYDVDLEPPPAMRSMRLVLLGGLALVVGGGIYLYGKGYAEHLESVARRVEASSVPSISGPTPGPGGTPAAGSAPAPVTVRSAAVVMATIPAPALPPPTPAGSTPAPLPSFDSAGARARVLGASVTSVSRPEQLGDAIRSDLVKLAVPVRSAKLSVVGKAGKGPASFALQVDYATGEDMAPATRAKHLWMIAAMVGRRANELKLNLQALTVRTWRGDRKVSETVLPAGEVKGVAAGSTTPEALLGHFVQP